MSWAYNTFNFDFSPLNVQLIDISLRVSFAFLFLNYRQYLCVPQDVSFAGTVQDYSPPPLFFKSEKETRSTPVDNIIGLDPGEVGSEW